MTDGQVDLVNETKNYKPFLLLGPVSLLIWPEILALAIAEFHFGDLAL